MKNKKGKKGAKPALGKTLQNEDLCAEDVRNKPFVGSHSAPYHARMSAPVQAIEDTLVSKGEYATYREEIAQPRKLCEEETKKFGEEEELATYGEELTLTQRTKKFEQDLITHREEETKRFEKIREDLAQLSLQSFNIAITQRGYMEWRNRFISLFKSNKLHTADNLDYQIIASEGYMAEHNADAITDAALYTPNTVLAQRFDTNTFEKLYGLHPAHVSRMSMSAYQVFSFLKVIVLTFSGYFRSTTEALNAHAAVISSPTRVASGKFYKSFSEFIELLKDSDYSESYLEDGKSSTLKDAYETFLQCAKDEVRKVEQG